MDEVMQQNEPLLRVDQLLEWNRCDEAIRETEKFVQMYPDDSSGYATLARCYLQKGEEKQALHWSDEALNKDPEDYLAWYIRVQTNYVFKKSKMTMGIVDEALRIFPEEDHYYFIKGNLYMDMEKPKKALSYFETAVELDADNPSYIALYSATLGYLGRKAESLELEQVALEINPDNAQVFNILGCGADWRGEYEKALEYFKNAIQLDPDDKDIRKSYIETLQKQFKVFRFFLFPMKIFAKFDSWILLPIWFGIFLLFRPLIVPLIILYVITFWATKLIVNKRVFGNIRGK